MCKQCLGKGSTPIEQVVKDAVIKQADDLANAFNAVKDQATFERVALEYIDTKKSRMEKPKTYSPMEKHSGYLRIPQDRLNACR